MSILADSLSQVGITLNLNPIDFQLLVNTISEGFEWEAVALAIAQPILPGQGSNVWVSWGNLHIWYPFQESPVNEWTARKDELFVLEGRTLDPVARQAISDEFELILQTQVPLIYLNREMTFIGVRNRWDFTNYFFSPTAGQWAPEGLSNLGAPRMWLR